MIIRSHHHRIVYGAVHDSLKINVQKLSGSAFVSSWRKDFGGRSPLRPPEV